MSVKDEKRIATTELRMVVRITGMGLLEHLLNEDILEEQGWYHVPITMVMISRKLEWTGHVKRIDETEQTFEKLQI